MLKKLVLQVSDVDLLGKLQPQTGIDGIDSTGLELITHRDQIRFQVRVELFIVGHFLHQSRVLPVEPRHSEHVLDLPRAFLRLLVLIRIPLEDHLMNDVFLLVNGVEPGLVLFEVLFIARDQLLELSYGRVFLAFDLVELQCQALVDPLGSVNLRLQHFRILLPDLRRRVAKI